MSAQKGSSAKCAIIFTAYLGVLVNLILPLHLRDDLEQKEDGFNHLEEGAESKMKQCRTHSSLRCVLHPGKRGSFGTTCK